MSVRRAAYELYNGSIPPKHDILESHPGCVNPAHLRLVTRAERMRTIASRPMNRTFTLTHLPAPPPSHKDTHRGLLRIYPASDEQFVDCYVCRGTWRV